MIIIKKWGLYKCIDYYKTEVIRFSNLDINLTNDEKEGILIEYSFINNNN